MVACLQEWLTYVDTSKPIDPGRVTVRRMHRTEYDNTTILDIFGIRLTLEETSKQEDTWSLMKRLR